MLSPTGDRGFESHPSSGEPAANLIFLDQLRELGEKSYSISHADNARNQRPTPRGKENPRPTCGAVVARKTDSPLEIEGFELSVPP